MTFIDLISYLKGKTGTLFLAGLFVAAVSFFGLTLSQDHYKTSTDFLVIQTNTQNQDYYTQFKSSEYLGKILAQALYSERFIDAVVETGKVNKEFLPFNKQDRLDTWHRMVTVQPNADLGMLHIALTGNNQKQNENIMSAIQTVLVERNSLFRGGDDKSVEVRLLSGPITDRNPSVKEIASVIVIGFFAGVFLMTFVLLVKGGIFQEESSFGISRDMRYSI